MDLGPRESVSLAVLGASFVAECAPGMLNVPALPYCWITGTAFATWKFRTVADTVMDGRRGGGGSARSRRRYQGSATPGELWDHLSLKAARGKARVYRPSLTGVRPRPAGPEVGVPLGRPADRGARWVLRKGLWGSPADSYLIIGPPQSGKSGIIGSMIVDAPGAVVSTSTRVDLYRNTVNNRLNKGPVWVLNTDRLGGVPSNLEWSAVTGCDTPTGAIERAGYLLDAAPGGKDGGGESKYWADRGKNLLQLLLHAAAISGRNVEDVYAWVLNPDDETPLRILHEHPDAAPDWWRELADFLGKSTAHIGSVTTMCKAALGWMSDPGIRKAASPPAGQGFNVAEFLNSRGTLYLIGADRPHGSAAPFLAAFTAYLFEETKRIAGGRKNNRLDPPLTLALDEAAIVCPIPLDRWGAETAGWGITVIVGTQDPSQLRERWGEHGAITIWNNSTVKVVFGGFTNDADLASLSRMCGEVEVRTGKDTVRTEPLMSPSRLRLIPFGQALLMHRRIRPVLIRTLNVWDRPDYDQAPPAPEDRCVTPAPAATEVWYPKELQPPALPELEAPKSPHPDTPGGSDTPAPRYQAEPATHSAHTDADGHPAQVTSAVSPG